MKKIIDDEEQMLTNSCSVMKSPFVEVREQKKVNFEDLMYVGSACAWGMTSIGAETKFNEMVYFWSHSVEIVSLRTTFGDCIEIPIIFAPFYSQIRRWPRLAHIQYYIDQSSSKTRKQLEDRKSLKKHHLKKLVLVRMDLYLNKNIYNQKTPEYSERIKEVDRLRTELYKLKRDTDHYKNTSNLLEELEYNINTDKLMRGLVMFLIEKMNVRVLNRSFVKPPPRMNFMMRNYRKKTIGLITKNKRNQRRVQMKIQKWKRAFRILGTLHHCIRQQPQSKYYSHLSNSQKFIWGGKQTTHIKEAYKNQTNKLVFRNSQGCVDEKLQSQLEESRKKLMQEMGADNFDQEEDGSQNQNEDNEDSMLMKRNEALMDRFEKENKHFRQHSNPENFVSTLKPYQKQALQWMKYRQGKITVEELFEEEYIKEIEQFEYERKLSPFWEEIELMNSEKLYINYLTGEFTQKFHGWKSIKGGILADEMGLGKTVMTLSLLADQNYEGLNLIVVPVAVIMQWKQQISRHCGPEVKVFEFHSNSKSRRKVKLNEYNIILITYATLGNQYKTYDQNREADTKYLFDYEFKRVILDQAHNIKGTKTLQFHGVMNLKSLYSWCLTGTLIQNSEQDLFAIFKFLRVDVFSEEYWWNQYIKNSTCTQAKLNVIQTVLRPIVLRRTKASTSNKGEIILTLKPKFQRIIRPKFTELENRIYKKLEQGVRSFFKAHSDSTKNYTHVFQIISKLRQFCCHPALIFGSDAADIGEKDIQSALNKFLQAKVTAKKFRETAIQTLLEAGTSCVICLEEPSSEKAVLTECGHFYCEPCIIQTLKKQNMCPLCRTPMSSKSYIRKQDIQDQVPIQIKTAKDSSKLIAIMEVVQQIHERKQKCVIFTQWIPIIALIEQKLIERGIQFGTIKGDIQVKKRQSIINRFRNDEECEFLIVSIRAGGTGLNLAFANNVMICDPWWNPSHEDQAIGRVHRLGQEKDVNVYRFYMKNSIEERIQKMHQNKRKIANQVMMQKGSLRQKKEGGAEQLIRLLE